MWGFDTVGLVKADFSFKTDDCNRKEISTAFNYKELEKATIW